MLEDNGLTMKHNSLSFNIDNIVFNCHIFGGGKKKLLAFHGFGQDGSAFLTLATQNPDVTVYAFDLPYHGGTKVSGKVAFLTSDHVITLIDKLIKAENLQTFSIIGFSIGAKFCIPIIERYFGRIKGSWLVAPDGLKANSWYRMATFNSMAIDLFRFVLDNPKIISRMGKIVTNLGLLKSPLLQFAERSLNTKQKRDQVFDTWVILRKLTWDSKALKSIINKKGEKVIVVLAEQDFVIGNHKIAKFIEPLNGVKLIKIRGGHMAAIRNFAKLKLQI